MARSLGSSIENSFIAGRISEATGLNFPENAVTEEENCIFDNTGRVSRRLGIDYEDDFVLKEVTRAGGATATYTWRNAAGSVNNHFQVVQIDSVLYFFAIGVEGPLSDNISTSTISLSTYKVSGSPSLNEFQCGFASGKGRLFVTHPYCHPFFVEFNPSTEVLSGTQINIQIRDFEGVADSLDLDERPTTLSDAHKYNLLNQGWYATVTDTDDVVEDALTAWDERTVTDYPSNADVWWLYKNSEDQFDISQIDKFQLPSTLANRGHYILNAFSQDRSTASGISGLTSTSSSYFRPSTCAFFGGRIFYSGVYYQEFGNDVYFSPVLERMDQVGQCYQECDPTSETDFELLSSDGGVLSIPEAGAIYRLVALETALVVFAANGIWVLTGSQGVGFAANDFVVKRVSGMNIPSTNSFVNVEGTPIWWADSGIYTLTSDQLGTVQVQSLTDKTIKEYFNSIPFDAKRLAVGAYNSTLKQAQWLFRRAAIDNDTDRYNYDSILNLNTLTGAFYTYTVDISHQTLNGVFAVEGLGPVFREVDVVDDNDDPVVDGNGNQVTASVVVIEPLDSVFMYITSVNTTSTTYKMTFSQAKDDSYKDWASTDYEVDYLSWFVSGFKVHGGANRKFQTNYLFTYLDDKPGASCFVEVIWNWGNSVSGPRIYSKQQVYSTAGNQSVQYTKRKLRGSGMAAQLKFTSETGKPFELIGWSIAESVTGNA